MKNKWEGEMGRPERHDVDYFPFFVKSGKTLDFLELKYGLEGTGYFTNILRFLSQTPDHYYCIKEETEKMVFLSRIKTTDEKKTFEIIEIMIKTGKLDKELWENHRVIASEDFLKSLEPAYEKRNNKVITIGEIKEKLIKGGINGVSDPDNSVKVGDNPQSKVKKSKVKKSKDTEATSQAVSDTSVFSKPEKDKKKPLREREPANDMERVEKAYLTNWDILYVQGKVKTINPIVSWNQTRKLLKTHFENFTAEQIIQAVNNGLNDEWLINAGYSLGMMLCVNVLNRLINGNGKTTKKHLIAADNVSQGTNYFKEAN
jgi:hypothetical protein